MIAVMKGHNDVVDVLISHKCNLNLQNKYGFNALMCALGSNQKDIAELMIRNHCDLELKVNGRMNALLLAVGSNMHDISALIIVQRYLNQNWDRRKALMLVLVGSNYLVPSSLPTTAAEGGGQVVLSPVRLQRNDAALMTSCEKVLCDMSLVKRIMRYI